MRNVAVTIASLAAGVFLSPGTARSQIVLASNLGDSSFGSGAVTTSTWVASEFQTTASLLYITSVTLSVASNPGANTGVVRIFTNSSGHPGTDTGLTFTTSTATGNVSFSATNSVTLSANTSYWVVASSTNGSSGPAINATTSTTGTGSGFETTKGETTSNSGSSWSTLSASGNQLTPMYSVTAQTSPIPEPGEWATLAAAAAGGWTWWRRRRRADA